MRLLPFALVILANPSLAAPVPPEPGSRERAVLESRLAGEWTGTGGCDGELTLRANGTFERRRFGPAGDAFGGTWAVRPTDPPTLVLTRADKDGDGRTELKVTRLDDRTLEYEYPGGGAGRHGRPGK